MYSTCYQASSSLAHLQQMKKDQAPLHVINQGRVKSSTSSPFLLSDLSPRRKQIPPLPRWRQSASERACRLGLALHSPSYLFIFSPLFLFTLHIIHPIQITLSYPNFHSSRTFTKSICPVSAYISFDPSPVSPAVFRALPPFAPSFLGSIELWTWLIMFLFLSLRHLITLYSQEE